VQIENTIAELECKLIPLLIDIYGKQLKTNSSFVERNSRVSRLKDEIIVEGCKTYVLLNTYLIALEVSRRFKNSFSVNFKNKLNYSPIYNNFGLEVQKLMKDPQIQGISLKKLIDIFIQIKNINIKVEKNIKIELKSYDYISFNRNQNIPFFSARTALLYNNEEWADILKHAGRLMNSIIYHV
jgi:hypothetical protein